MADHSLNLNLGTEPLVAFVATTDLVRAREFYVETLGLRFVDEDDFALQVSANGVLIRITPVPDHTPAGFTVLGWSVGDIGVTLTGLRSVGVEAIRYPWFEQSDDGVWTAPSGDRVAWFADPDGNVLSLTQMEVPL